MRIIPDLISPCVMPFFSSVSLMLDLMASLCVQNIQIYKHWQTHNTPQFSTYWKGIQNTDQLSAGLDDSLLVDVF